MRLLQYLKPALTGLVFFIAGCEQPVQQQPLLQLSGPTMGSSYNLSLVAPAGGLPADAQQQIDRLLADIDQQFSTWRDDSELARFNQQQGTEPVAVSSELVVVAREALRIGKLSDGALDVTVGPLLKLWGFDRHQQPEVLPDETAIAAVRAVTGLDKLQVTDSTFAKVIPPLSLDFSALVAGHAADRLASLIDGWGVNHYLLEVTGEMRVKGMHPASRPWRIAVEKPVAGGGRSVERVIELRDIGVATSGDYRNFYEIDGQRYSHTINPQSGKPIDHLMVSVTVLDPSAMTADGWATALMAVGPEQAKQLAEQQRLAVLLILKQDDAFIEWSSSAMAPYLTTINKED
ncbi:MAG: FAD:protein FMN transferase [Gammaproteobacteria bacterium]|nr:FAD:protein FMN transferase [Gammaproteobacteria bacterium]